MAPTRQRNSGSTVQEHEDEAERSPKAQRLSNGSRSRRNGGGSAVDESDEEDMSQAERPGYKGKGKGKRSSDNAMEQDNEEEKEEGEDDMVAKARRMAEICRQQEAEDRELGGGGDMGLPSGGKENQGPQPSGSKKGKGGLSKQYLFREKTTEAGVVLKINVKNFMCHKNFTVHLCKQMNFINGRNGSGKSAILAALQICLGAKANSTHRAKRLSDFIRHGWDKDAVLEVTLLNGPEGFMYKEYGKSITVRRTIKQPSGGSFALLDENGEVVSKDKAELHRMLDMLNIQVDNPCAVLDQENSKKFLQGSERDKYAFFMKATDLDRIDADNLATGVEIDKMTAGRIQAVDQLPRYREVVQKLRAEVKEFDSLEDLQRKISQLKEEMAWVIVEDEEEKLADCEESLKYRTLLVDALRNKIADMEEMLAQATARKEEVKQQLDAGVIKVTKLKEEAIKTRAELEKAQQPLLVLRSQRSALESEQGKRTEAKKRAERAVKNAREVAKRTASDDQEKRLHASIQQTEERLSNLGRIKEGRGGEDELFRLRHNLKEAKEVAGKARGEYDMLEKELKMRRDEIRNLDAGTFDPLSALGNYMPGLVLKIKQSAGKFRSPPVGPLGACIQLKEDCKIYRICIEGHLGKTLNNFVVSSQQDKTILMGLMKSFRQNFRGNKNWPLPTIIVQTAVTRYNPPQNPPGCLQVMQAINVTDDQAFNALLDQSSIEKTCLFPSKEDAEKVCLIGNSGRYQRMPHGMYEAYYPSLGGRSCSRFSVSDGNIQTRMNVVSADRHRSVLGVDEGTRRSEAEMQVQTAQQASSSARLVADGEARKAKAAESALKQVEETRDQAARQEGQLTREKQQLQAKLMALQAKNTETTDPTEELERNLEDATEELENVKKELATVEGGIRETVAQIQPHKDAKEEARRAHAEATVECNKMSEQLEEEGTLEAQKHQRLARAKAKIAKSEEEVKEASVMRDTAIEAVKLVRDKADSFMVNSRKSQGLEWDGQRIKTKYSLETLKHKVKVSSARYEKERESKKLRGTSKNEVMKQLDQAIKTFREKDELANRLESNIDMLTAERRERTTRWMLMRKYIARRTSTLFDEYLQEKGASGEVIFDYENNTLGLTYQKDSLNDDSQCSDVKLLSGGERSFATLALLLALGQGHECPFRVMDEFDVFMDAMSRNIAIKQVTTFAKKNSNRQFILITPQDLSSVTPSETCKIIKMLPPRKGDHNQATLEESFARGGGSS